MACSLVGLQPRKVLAYGIRRWRKLTPAARVLLQATANVLKWRMSQRRRRRWHPRVPAQKHAAHGAMRDNA
eukprot:11434927-Alexandrium_andersonii.AAC.1